MSNKIITLDGLNTFLSNVKTYLTELLLSKQDKLISGENIVTVNGNSILTSGNIIAGDISFEYTDFELDDPEYQFYYKKYFTIEALEDGLTAKLSVNACEYRIDNGDWTSLTADTDTIAINTGQTLSFKGNLTPTSSGIGTFTISKKCNLKGNCMSLLYGDDFEGQIDLTDKNYAFYKLFSGCTNVVEAHRLILPATALAIACYPCMFYNCTSLTTAPELPATTLTLSCYYEMFKGCTSLTTAPSILPATTLAQGCCHSMFYGCTSLTTTPELPATTLAVGCYHSMFYGCSSLNNIVMLATDVSEKDCLINWVSGVSNKGTFVKAAGVEIPIGTSGIPSGWTVRTA